MGYGGFLKIKVVLKPIKTTLRKRFPSRVPTVSLASLSSTELKRLQHVA